MKTQVKKKSELQGKMIKKVIEGLHSNGNTKYCLFTFTDDTFFLVSASVNRYAHLPEMCFDEDLRLSMFPDAVLVDMEILSQEEIRNWRQKEEHERQVRQNKEDRRLYEALKKKFEDPDGKFH